MLFHFDLILRQSYAISAYQSKLVLYCLPVLVLILLSYTVLCARCGVCSVVLWRFMGLNSLAEAAGLEENLQLSKKVIDDLKGGTWGDHGTIAPRCPSIRLMCCLCFRAL